MTSSSVPIPNRGHSSLVGGGGGSSSSSSSRISSSSSSSSSNSPASLAGSWSSPSSAASSYHSRAGDSGKGKAPMSASPLPVVDRVNQRLFAPRRPSLLGSSLSKSEHTVVHLGSADGAPRLITCVKSSQGFDWNQELFLPSYANYDAEDLNLRQEPVLDIVLTEEEAAAMLPQ